MHKSYQALFVLQSALCAMQELYTVLSQKNLKNVNAYKSM